MLRIAFMLAGLALLSGCQQTTLELLTVGSQQRFYSDGATAVLSKSPKSVAMVAAQTEPFANGERISLALKVENIGPAPFDIDTANVTVASTKASRHKVHSYDDLVREEKQRATAMLVLSAIAGAANAYSAAQASTVHTSGTFHTSYGSGTYSGTVHDPLRGQIASQLAGAQTSAQMSRIASDAQANIADLRGSILKRTTVFPGTMHGGMFVFDAPPLEQKETRTYFITVAAGEEAHKFQIVQRWQ
jgi:hypothetical protein